MLHGPNAANPPSSTTIEAMVRAHSQIASVADAAARNTLAAGITGITASNPVWVYRQDTQTIEMTTNGTTWRTWNSDIYAGGEINYLGSAAAAGTRMVHKSWILTENVAGETGAVIFYFPQVFSGITNIQYSCLTQNTRLTFWYMGGDQLFCTATNLAGSYIANGVAVKASIRIEGWL